MFYLWMLGVVFGCLLAIFLVVGLICAMIIVGRESRREEERENVDRN